jgi:hypothetical protein
MTAPAPDFRALCAELIKIVEDHCNPDDYALLDVVCTLTDARTALATSPPELSEAEGLAEWLYERGQGQDLGMRDWYFKASCLLKQLAAVKATPPPEPPMELPTDDELVALKEKLWDEYKTIGYLGEEFMYDSSFGHALDDYRAVLKRWGQR